MALNAKWNQSNNHNEKSLPAAGISPATIETVSAEYGVITQGRVVDRIVNRYKLDNGMTVTQKYIWYLSESSKLGQLVMNLLGKSDDVNLEDLVGMRCQVKIEHNHTSDGKLWVNVTEVYPLAAETQEYNSRQLASKVRDEQRRSETANLFSEETKTESLPF